MRPLAVMFHRLGPYHRARLNALSRRVPVVVVELFGGSREYDWAEVDEVDACRKISLFPDRACGDGSAVEVIARTRRALAELQPLAVAIPGWYEHGALAALLWAVENGRPAILMSESQGHDRPRDWCREWIKKQVVSLCSTGLAGGRLHADYLADLGLPRERIFLGYDVIDNDYFSAEACRVRAEAAGMRARLGLPEHYFLAVARFIAPKNLPGLLASYRLYLDGAGPRAWKLVLVGDGPLAPELAQEIDRLDLREWVVRPGFRQYRELPAYYALAGVFVQASTVEPWGLVVNEAMACGLPVLVSERCGCAGELVAAGRNGFVFDPQDPAELASLLGRLSAEGCDRAAMGQASREVVARWSPGIFATNMQAALDLALAKPARAARPLAKLVLQGLLRG